MLSMARSTCACCAGPWTWGNSTKSCLSAIRPSFRNSRTTSFPPVVAVWLWAISKQSLLIEAERLLIRDLRTIPTHVGRTDYRQCLVGIRSDHPHARGENVSIFCNPPAPSGPSPCTWGELAHRERGLRSNRTIPTHVGRTMFFLRQAKPSTDHPHARGENPTPGEDYYTAIGPSPRTWGERRSSGKTRRPARTIPTHVGRT